MDYIKEKFAIIEDNRHSSYVEHSLTDILTIIMCAVLCGLDELADITTYAQSNAKFLKKKFNITKIPSKATFSRILNMMDADKVASVIIEIMHDAAYCDLGDVIAVDGKAIRSTSKKGTPHSALQILTVYLTQSGIVLGQKSIHEKTNEIPVFQQLLDNLNIKDKTVTADAMHCQKETCKKIIAKHGNYVFGLKENQKTLHDDVKFFFDEEFDSKTLDSYTTVEKNGGRIEKRICKKCSDIKWLNGYKEWAGLSSIFAVKRITTTNRGTSDETGYYITSKDTDAKELLHICREHWKIESMHWLLDVTFSEDECSIISENGQKTLNSLRKLALLLHKRYLAKQLKKCSIKANLLKCLMNSQLLCEVADL